MHDNDVEIMKEKFLSLSKIFGKKNCAELRDWCFDDGKAFRSAFNSKFNSFFTPLKDDSLASFSELVLSKAYHRGVMCRIILIYIAVLAGAHPTWDERKKKSCELASELWYEWGKDEYFKRFGYLPSSLSAFDSTEVFASDGSLEERRFFITFLDYFVSSIQSVHPTVLQVQFPYLLYLLSRMSPSFSNTKVNKQLEDCSYHLIMI